MNDASRVRAAGDGPASYVLRHPPIVIAWIVAALTAIGLFAVWVYTRAIATDFGVYWRTANGPLSEAYSPVFEYPFPYAPTMLFWITPLAALPLWPAFLAFSVLSAAAMFAVCREQMSRSETWLVVISPPLSNGLMTGQASALLAAALIWAMGHRDRLTAGLVIGLIATVKPQVVCLAPLFFIVARDWRALVGSGVSCSAILMATYALFGLQPWLDWIEALPHFRQVLIDKFIMGAVITPTGFAEWYQVPRWPLYAIGAGIGILLVVTVRAASPIMSAAVITAGSLLVSPYAMTYDLAAIVPFLVYSLYRGSMAAAFAFSSIFNPAPLLLTAYQLVRRGS